MDWPTAAVILGIITGAAPVIYKMIPARNSTTPVGDHSGINHNDLHNEIHDLKIDLDKKFEHLNSRIDKFLLATR